ncbi:MULTISPECIES: O-antigen polymerase [Calothrix]|uniref:Oligosaccharide repeat unit polymerase n=2 Tax=Calothrix TaxID=1186 RepID=A0ABR8ACR8_9CYAN|nr:MULTISPECIES: O-antigen polymerase [Calothrix]MBD2197807.1 oligosaccharide repeat unit polymerase [Calothrix parietina FACHB-288]MBD2226211.1 oligosaccharide repeat unit polymerase [Calothrix anomala FACHB-343]
MWRKIVSPEILFLLGTLQALFPYIIWMIQGPNENYNYEITYLPLFLWTIGYFFFWLGTRFFKSNVDNVSSKLIKISFNGLKRIIFIISVLIIIQIINIVQAYGFLPILEFFSGSININDVNNNAVDTGFGQLGIFVTSLFFLNGLLLSLVIKAVESHKKLSLFFVINLLIAIFGTLITGKRQGLFILVFFIFSGLSIRFNSPLKTFIKVFGLQISKQVRILLYILVPAILIYFMGFIASLRIGSGYQISGTDETINYLQWPLINFEAQCEQAGLGPYKFNPIYSFVGLLPYRLYEDYVMNNDLPPSPEPSSPVGFYGNLHWGLGITGIIVFALIFGMISKYFYKRSFFSLPHLLIYCQITWTLIAAHTYNHFLSLVFLPLPALCFLFFGFLCNVLSPKNN